MATWSTKLLIHVYFSYAATSINEDIAVGLVTIIAEQLVTINILKN